jgi:hypothetical protein
MRGSSDDESTDERTCENYENDREGWHVPIKRHEKTEDAPDATTEPTRPPEPGAQNDNACGSGDDNWGSTHLSAVAVWTETPPPDDKEPPEERSHMAPSMSQAINVVRRVHRAPKPEKRGQCIIANDSQPDLSQERQDECISAFERARALISEPKPEAAYIPLILFRKDGPVGSAACTEGGALLRASVLGVTRVNRYLAILEAERARRNPVGSSWPMQIVIANKRQSVMIKHDHGFIYPGESKPVVVDFLEYAKPVELGTYNAAGDFVHCRITLTERICRNR